MLLIQGSGVALSEAIPVRAGQAPPLQSAVTPAATKPEGFANRNLSFTGDIPGGQQD